jgi:pyridoxamine 5'-phosphate oxidase
MLNINHLRREYRLKPLDLNHLNADPFSQFSTWFVEAEQAQVLELNAMALATVSLEGRPSCRTVLLKQMDARGFSFFTNYESRKGQELSNNPFACITFYWAVLERQIIIEGRVEKLTQKESETYFASRPRSSQLGAWASQQSQVVRSREELEEAYHHFEEVYDGKEIPLPPYWGGYRLLPTSFEFWQGRPNRMHDRFRYRLQDNIWIIERLAP